MRLAWLLPLLVSACADVTPGQTAGEGPGLGKADSGDIADHDCSVVLDHVERDGSAEGPDGRRYFTFSGEVLIKASLGTPAVLYSGMEGGWWEVTTDRVPDGDVGGLARYRFRLTAYTVEEGLSAGALSRARLQIIPYVHTLGGRLFDHNRVTDDLAAYVVDLASGWAIAGDGTCQGSRVRATLDYQVGWTRSQRGALTPGGALTINYDPERLTACRAWHSGFAAWSLTAHVRFLPSGEEHQGSVTAVTTVNGYPQGQPHAAPFTTDIPTGAERAEIWFENSDIQRCQAFDSNLGQNYVYDVVAPPAAPAWAGGWGGSWSRRCEHGEGLAEPLVFDEYTYERACTWVDADVYAPGVTDADHPEWLYAEVEWQLDDGSLRHDRLQALGRVGNDQRFRWNVEHETLARETWSQLHYRLRFSTDGVSWFAIAQGDGPDGGARRTIVNDRH